MKKYDSYKDSGIEWYGSIPNHWNITRLKFLGNAFGGVTYSPKDIVEDSDKGVLVLRSSNIQNGKLDLSDTVCINQKISEKLTVRNGDILICSRNGSRRLIGKNICIDKRTSGQTFGAFMMVFRSTYYKWLSKYFNSPIFKSQSGLFLTSTINQLTSGTLNNFSIAIPPSKDEQTQIANYLDQKTTEIDNLISKKEKLIALHKEERTAVINQAVTKGLDPNVPMKDSGIECLSAGQAGLGEVPKHWNRARIKNVANIIGRIGFRGYTTADIVEEGRGAVSLSPSNIKNQKLILEKCTYLSWEKYHESPEIQIFTNDIILVKTGSTIGKTAIVFEETPKMTLNPQLVVLKDIQLHSKFLYFLMISSYFQGYFNIYTAGGSTPAISQEKINNFQIVFPDSNGQKLIVAKLEKMESSTSHLINKYEQEIKFLKEYKTALISEVVTGKVDVRNELTEN